MNDKQKFEDCVIDNDEYFYRDQEMARSNMNDIKYQVDPNIDKQKQKTKKHHFNSKWCFVFL